VFETVFTENGGEIIGGETYGPDDTDFRTQITKIKSLDPEVVYLAPQSATKGTIILKQMVELGLDPQLVMDAIMIRGALKEAAEELEGTIGIEPDFDDTKPEFRALIDEYVARHGEEPQFFFYDAATYDAVYLLAEAIGKYGDDTEAVRDYFYSLENHPGMLEPITMDENGDLVMKFVIIQVKNGELVPFEAKGEAVVVS